MKNTDTNTEGFKNDLTREELKEKLKYGDINKIAKATNCSRLTVTRWFNHENDRSDIRTAAELIIQAAKDQLAQNVKNLV